MTAAEIIAALGLPPEALLDKRIPKSALLEAARLTAADRRSITADVEELRWEAILKDTTVAIPAFSDADHSYSEIVAVSAILRGGANMPRLNLLIHRAVQYPLVLVTEHADRPTISLAPKRRALNQDGVLVIEGDPIEVTLAPASPPSIEQSFLDGLWLARQAAGTLQDLYWRWIEAIEALQAARTTGTFEVPETAEQAAARRAALYRCTRLDADIAALRRQAAAERQMRRQIELSDKIRSLRAEYTSARSEL